MTEQPYKIPYYANILRALDEGNDGVESELLGKQILDDFWKGFQGYLDKLSWRDVRLCVGYVYVVNRKPLPDLTVYR